MGFNSTLVVLNDALHIIEKDTEFGKKVKDAILEKYSYRDRRLYISSGNHANVAEVIEVHHADMKHIIAVGGNTGWDFGPKGFYRASEEELCRAWANDLGFVLHKKSQKAK